MSTVKTTFDKYIMPFGKYIGKPLNEIPLKYLDWLQGEGFLRGKTKEVVTKYLNDPVISAELERVLEEGGVEE